MFNLTTLRARHLSRTGRHTEALSLCKLSDTYVLSRAGMHLSVLDQARRPSVEMALAMARTGRIDAALELAARFAGKTPARTLLGALAVDAPDSVHRIVRNQRGLDEIKAYCGYACGIDDDYDFESVRLSPIHRMLLALKAGHGDGAKTQFNRLFWEAGLEVPHVAWQSRGIVYESLCCEGGGRSLEAGPLISVILTAHNEQALLPVAVKSLQLQSWRNLEIVIVDDASTDGTREVADGFARQDGRIKVVHLDRNVGLWAAKNIGLQHCTGGIITMHDADDWSHSRKIELQVAPLLQSPGLVATSSHMVRVDQHSGAPYTRNARNFLRWNPSSFMFRARHVDAHGGFLDNLLGSDCEFVARLETLYGIDAHVQLRLPLSIGLQRSGSLSNRFRGPEGLVRFRHWEQWRRRHVEGLLEGAPIAAAKP